MPRANRYFIPNHVWHITHRCHKQEFLLKFAHDRRRWRYWLFEARKRYSLCVLNYIVTSNHIHLLVKDHGNKEIACVLRNQMIHGGATWNSGVSRDQVRDSANIMERLIPAIIYIMMEDLSQDWGVPSYPVVE